MSQKSREQANKKSQLQNAEKPDKKAKAKVSPVKFAMESYDPKPDKYRSKDS